MNDRIAAMKELELRVERTLKMSEEEQLRVLIGLQETIRDGLDADMFWIMMQRNRLYHNTTDSVKRAFKEHFKNWVVVE